jgi:type II secretory pathway component GspD/PulD (secretin)
MRGRGIVRVAIVALLPFAFVAQAQEATSLRSIDARRTEAGYEVRLTGDGALTWKSMRLSSPPRLVVDVQGVRNGVGEKVIAAAGAVRTVRVAQFRVAPKPVTRVVLDLAGDDVKTNVAGDGRVIRIAAGESALPVAIPSMISAVVDPPRPEPERAPRLRHLVYDLSYTQADRALAVLKALGYNTVEFSSAAGDSRYDQLYRPVAEGGTRKPTVIKLIDAPKTSLMDRDPAAEELTPQQAQLMAAQAGKRQAVPDIGGTYLHQSTTGEPQERLLIVYDEGDPAALEELLALLREDLDVAARQVVISALVLEINTDRARELGIQFGAGNGRNDVSFEKGSNGSMTPFTYVFDKAAQKTAWVFSAKLQALIENGEAEVLSNPSVLVLDGRQARIQVGQQVPVVNSTSTAAGITSSVEYFPVGIVLNLRPRINQEGSEVTMQVETIVSAVAQSSTTSSSVFFAPTVDNRQVQTFVRVADNTPFIIGGLISSDAKTRKAGIPGLARVPVVGSLFGRNAVSAAKREVVVVLTPHVVPQEDRSFSYLIPKDSGRFDSFERTLFRNAYRIRSSDLYDLQFVYESEVLRNLRRTIEARAASDPSLRRTEPYASLLRGEIPGEGILVRRMLWEIVKRSGLAEKIDPKQILVFQPSAADPQSTDFEASFLDKRLAQIDGVHNAMLLSFNANLAGTPEHPFVQPKGEISYESVQPQDYEKRLIEANARHADGTPDRWSILLTDAYSGSTAPLDILRNVLVLKRVLSLNSSLPLTISEFKVGRQIIFPTEDDIARTVHVVDRDAARLFYESKEYYRAFEQEFNSTTRNMMNTMGRR